MNNKGKGQEDQIVASGEALQAVARLLGVADASAELDAAADEEAAPRPQGLGLGARFLPHNKALALVSGVDRRLGKRLQGSSEGGGAGGSSQHGGGQGGGGKGQARPREESSDEDGDDVGRASAFKKARPAPAATYKASFLTTQGPGKKKKKKTKPREGGGAPAGGGTRPP